MALPFRTMQPARSISPPPIKPITARYVPVPESPITSFSVTATNVTKPVTNAPIIPVSPFATSAIPTKTATIRPVTNAPIIPVSPFATPATTTAAVAATKKVTQPIATTPVIPISPFATSATPTMVTRTATLKPTPVPIMNRKMPIIKKVTTPFTAAVATKSVTGSVTKSVGRTKAYNTRNKKKDTRTVNEKFESCVKKVKAKQSPGCAAMGYPSYKTDAQGNKCYNPWAVCNASVRGQRKY